MTEPQPNPLNGASHSRLETRAYPGAPAPPPREQREVTRPAARGVKRGGAPNWTTEQAREASRKAAQVRRERAAARREREQAASRSTREVLADKLLAEHEKVERTVARLLEISSSAQSSNLDVVRASTALVRLLDQAFGRVQSADQPDPDDDQSPWELMTPAQRAKRRAMIEALLMADEEGLAEPGGDGGSSEGPRADA
jgi:hypothetical protein